MQFAAQQGVAGCTWARVPSATKPLARIVRAVLPFGGDGDLAQGVEAGTEGAVLTHLGCLRDQWICRLGFALFRALPAEARGP